MTDLIAEIAKHIAWAEANGKPWRLAIRLSGAPGVPAKLTWAQAETGDQLPRENTRREG